MRDVIIIGAGVTGSAIARELSRYNRDVLVLEKNSDVAEGTSKANSGIVHAGYDAKPGSLMAKLNLQGNLMMEQLSRDLDFPFKKNGSLVLCFSEEDRPKLEELYQRGVANGVPDIKILSKEEVLAMEPNITEEIVGALYAPTGGIVCPFNLTIALAENACENGVEFQLNTAVTGLEKTEKGYLVHTDKGDYETAMVVNAAGLYADVFHNMVSEEKIHITPRKGEYCLMDKKVGDFVKSTVFQLPGKYGKGVLVTPTVHGNLLVGPTATDQEDKEQDQTTQEGLADVLEKAGKSVKSLPRQIITSFAGLRAHGDTGDFIIGEVKDAPGFIDAAGIESPGLTSAPAIGIMVADLIQELSPAEKKSDFIATRKGIPSMALATNEERAALIRENPAYANVICRCETVTEGEILEAIHRPLG
ncbi:MAG: NAD(P)/FAD-dependent oxidoreductase, partial [Lachnospiraceae bacterium]|nr:NAD(P)/FAD-dependent oxidoreductase [Lachnospiraceae bacterium]